MSGLSIEQAVKQMIDISSDELTAFLSKTFTKKIGRGFFLSQADVVPDAVFFINSGLLRVLLTNDEGVEFTTHFALEGQFIADYASFMQATPAFYSLQALEDTEVVVLPRSAVMWGYENLQEGQKLGRLIAEYYFIYHENRIKNLYARTPKQRYEIISDIFPNIHNRVPQHMIASYLGITPVHLSRLKKMDRQKT